MAGNQKKNKRRSIIAPYVDDEIEQREDDYAEFQEWKRNRDQRLLEEEEQREARARQTTGKSYSSAGRSNSNTRRSPGSTNGTSKAPRRREGTVRRDPMAYGEYDERQYGRRRRRAYEEDYPPTSRRRTKKRHPFRLIFILILVILMIFLIGTGISMVGFGTGSSVRNYLLIGQDRREGEDTQRSDSMIIVSVNKDTKEITLVSVMRDLYVEIPGHDSNRINAAYEYGGMDLLDETIENALDLKIDGNAEVDFEQFISAMSVVGDLEIELTQEEADYLNVNSSYGGVENYAWNLTAGVNSLTPEQALAYSRIRYVGNSDWERTQRQRTVITTAFDKLKSQGPIKMVQVVSQIIPNLTTDMGANEITALAVMIGIGGYDIGESYRVPFDGTYSNRTLNSGAEVLSADLEANAEQLKTILYES